MKVDKLAGGYPGGFFLEDLSFTIEEGKMYALLGLNGSGKTTILKMLCGLLKAQSGSVLADGVNILDLDENARARLISYVPQFSGLTFDISVLDVVLMGISPYLKRFQTPNAGHRSLALRCLRELGMEELAYANYQTLSGGQKQMAVIARALLQNGRYLFLDEPDSSLDLVNKNKLMKQIRVIVNTLHKGCLISMHNPEYALNYCDHVFLVKNGRISEIDMVKEENHSIEEKLSEVFGPVRILQHMQKYILFYE